MSPTTAGQLRDMMRRVVEEGTGTAANVEGLSVAGKTGTAETGVTGTNTTSFMTFAPAYRARVALAVVLENQHGFAGQTAAPKAKQIMEALLHARSNS